MIEISRLMSFMSDHRKKESLEEREMQVSKRRAKMGLREKRRNKSKLIIFSLNV